MNDENRQDGAEPSLASDGSVDAASAIEAAFDGGGQAAKKVRACISGLEKEIASLRAAAAALYRHRWACDDLQPGEQAALWESMRDAIGLPPGTATSMGVHGRVEQ